MGNYWVVSNNIPIIETGELHLWRAFLSANTAPYTQYLDEQERERMQRFRFEHDRRMYGFSHVLMRRLLAGYLGVLPKKIGYSYTQYGKPYLRFQDRHDRIEFNLSHSGEVILIAVAITVPVGVDVEKIKPLPEMDQIAARFFSNGEQVDLSSLSGSAKLAAYYHCWTRKEAVIKASGEGLSMPLDSFRVSFLPGEPTRLVKSADQRAWLLLDIKCAKGYAAAVAAPVDRLQVSYFSAEGL